MLLSLDNHSTVTNPPGHWERIDRWIDVYLCMMADDDPLSRAVFWWRLERWREQQTEREEEPLHAIARHDTERGL